MNFFLFPGNESRSLFLIWRRRLHWVTDNQLLISSLPAFARLITSFCAVKFLSFGMSSFPLCKRTEEIIYPAGICKVQLTCNANRKMEIDRSSFSFFGETMQNKTDMTNWARSDKRLLDHLLILDFGTPLIERNVALLC